MPARSSGVQRKRSVEAKPRRERQHRSSSCWRASPRRCGRDALGRRHLGCASEPGYRGPRSCRPDRLVAAAPGAPSRKTRFRKRCRPRVSAFGWAWLAGVLALALHVADEATHNFLAWYNPQALRIRQALGGLPFPPTFTFWPWLFALGAAVLVLSALTPFAFAGARWLRGFGYAMAVVHILNGFLHVAGAVRSRRAVPGVLSAPLLIVTGFWLWYAAGQRVH